MIYYLVNSDGEVNPVMYDGTGVFMPASGWQMLHETGYTAWREENPEPPRQVVHVSGAGASIYYSETPPSGAREGQLWFSSSDGHTYIYYVEKDGSSQWVSINAALPVGATYMSSTEPTGSGIGIGQSWFDTTTNINYIRYSGAQGLGWISNADKLDGNDGVYFRNVANLTGVAALSGSFTGTLTGTASNADLLDNLDSTYFRDGANLTGTINATQLSGQNSAYYTNLANLTGIAQISGSFTGSLAGTATNATTLNSQPASYYLNASNITGNFTNGNLLNGSSLTGTINATQLDSQAGSYYRNAANLSGSFTGTANNATNLNSQSAAYYLNAGNLSGTFTGTANNANNLGSYSSAYYLNAGNLTGMLALARLPVAADNTSTATGIVRADDSRLNNARTPTSHNHAASEITSGTISADRLPLATIRAVPQSSQSGGYTTTTSDIGKHVIVTSGPVYIGSSIYSAGDIFTIFNNSGSSITISANGTTVRQAGTSNTGNRTLAQYGIATVLCVASNTFVIAGSGIS